MLIVPLFWSCALITSPRHFYSRRILHTTIISWDKLEYFESACRKPKYWYKEGYQTKLQLNYSAAYFGCILTTLVFVIDKLLIFYLVTAVIVTLVTEVGSNESMFTYIFIYNTTNSHLGDGVLAGPIWGKKCWPVLQACRLTNSTTFTRRCGLSTVTTTLTSSGSSSTFSTASNIYCSVVSNNPITINQLGPGESLDSLGDPIISTIPAIDWGFT